MHAGTNEPVSRLNIQFTSTRGSDLSSMPICQGAVEPIDTDSGDGKLQTVDDSRSGGSGCGPTSIAVIIVFSILATIFFQYTSRQHVAEAFEWMSRNVILGRGLFLVLNVASVVLMLPGSVLALLGGAVFGMYWGLFLVYIGTVLGQTLAFLLSRFLMRAYVRSVIDNRWRKFSLIDNAMQREGWKLVCMLRLSPCVPYNLLNYGLGVTGIPFLEYTCASAVAIIPYVTLFVYAGCVSKNIFEILEGNWSVGDSMWTWVAVGGVAAVMLMAYLYLFTTRALDEALENVVSPGRQQASPSSQPYVHQATGQSTFRGEKKFSRIPAVQEAV